LFLFVNYSMLGVAIRAWPIGPARSPVEKTQRGPWQWARRPV